MNPRPAVLALLFSPEILMGDVFRVTRKIAPALPYLTEHHVIALRQELALFEHLVDRCTDRAAQLRARFGPTVRYHEPRVLAFPSTGRAA